MHRQRHTQTECCIWTTKVASKSSELARVRRFSTVITLALYSIVISLLHSALVYMSGEHVESAPLVLAISRQLFLAEIKRSNVLRIE